MTELTKTRQPQTSRGDPFWIGLAENSLRPIKLGAKNWLFIGNETAGPRAAMMFTFVENCRLARVNPETWFTDILTRIDDQPASRIEELIPQNWAKSKNT